MGADNYMQIMIDSLHKKEEILKKIVVLNDEQAQIASASEFSDEKFYANMESKGDLIEELLKLDEGFNSLFNRIKEEVGDNKSKYAQQIKELQDLIKLVTELGVKVEVQESRNKSLVEKRFAKMKREVANAGRNTKMANTYYKNQNMIDNQPHFVDNKK